MSATPSYQTGRWSMHFEEIDQEIATLALMCEVPLLNPGVIERVLANEPAVCGKDKPASFAKLRGLLMMHYSDQNRAMVALGEEQAMAMINEVIERLRARFGDRLGTPAA
ncbi:MULTISPECIES: hypothetical protein [unclassified Roseateles]|uniref:hypothetical protein n=1 Tax=unclassified Roseateles TaxID=2626991 RepID=UPI000733BE5E|nr:hypothetical protein [Paucibacter sp. KCTC 42545]ALT77838.1 hypothetical protein AT984_12250 [Paucibacter sp. KCTC 42545]